jgi:ubiquinone/menaquinone biosynthesis C-methylase UbiE
MKQEEKPLFSKENMHKIKCIFCDGHLSQVDKEYYQCERCEEKYPIVFGIPYFYKYRESDILGLIEIAANKNFLAQGSPFNVDGLKKWNALLKKGLLAGDHKDYINTSPDWAKPWLEDRYREYAIFTKLTSGENLKNAVVLDVGAGFGFDSYHLVSEGANVTALEFSPILAKCGKESIPMVNWVCGSASFLPFQNQIFDYIFCNATLHHVDDVESALYEMLRVLKPGGCIFTISDSYYSSSGSKSAELEVFNDHQDVLGGINESIINIEILTNIFDKFIDYLDIEAIAHISNSILTEDSPLKNKFDKNGFIGLKYIEHKSEIRQNFNGLSFKIRLKKTLKIYQKKFNKLDLILEPKEYAESLIDDDPMLNKLIESLPVQYMDLDLLNGAHNKFFLLNGLQKPFNTLPWRRAYKRSRLFLSSKQKNIRYSLRICGKEKRSMTIRINGKKVSEFGLSDKWISINLDLGKSNTRSVAEFYLEQKESSPPFFLISPHSPFLINLFFVRKFLTNMWNSIRNISR